MRRVRRRWIVLVGAVGVALVVLLFPPWRARAIRTTTRYAATADVAPEMAVDTITWLLAFAPIYAPPRASLDPETMRLLATRASLAGDSDARAELLRSAGKYESRLHVPEVLRVSGSVWRDSVLAHSGIPSVTSYALTFVIAREWLVGRLAVLAGLWIYFGRRSANPRPKSSGASGRT